MWTDMDAAEPAEIEKARAGLERLFGGARVETESTATTNEREVVVTMALPVGVRGERASLELRDGALLVHLPRSLG